jgi:hypothetical protein
MEEADIPKKCYNHRHFELLNYVFWSMPPKVSNATWTHLRKSVLPRGIAGRGVLEGKLFWNGNDGKVGEFSVLSEYAYLVQRLLIIMIIIEGNLSTS